LPKSVITSLGKKELTTYLNVHAAANEIYFSGGNST